MNETKHTPLLSEMNQPGFHSELPWHANGSQIIGPKGKRHQYIADVSRDNGIMIAQSNAAFIVRAVNTIDEVTKQRDVLLAACKDWIKYFESDLPKTGEQSEVQGEEFTAAWFKTTAAIAACEKGGVKP